jgi:hypothetical protein
MAYPGTSPAVSGAEAAVPAAAPVASPPPPAANPAPSAAPVAAPAQNPASGAPTGFGAEALPQQKVEGPKSVSVHVKGTFDGLKKGTYFHLDDGQLWVCIDDGRYDYEAVNPAATIRRNLIGSYWMLLEGSGFEIRVKRVN